MSWLVQSGRFSISLPPILSTPPIFYPTTSCVDQFPIFGMSSDSVPSSSSLPARHFYHQGLIRACCTGAEHNKLATAEPRKNASCPRTIKSGLNFRGLLSVIRGFNYLGHLPNSPIDNISLPLQCFAPKHVPILNGGAT